MVSEPLYVDFIVNINVNHFRLQSIFLHGVTKKYSEKLTIYNAMYYN